MMEFPVAQTGKEKEKEMSEVKPKIKGARKYRKPTRAVGLIKKEFSTKVLGLEGHTFDIGNTKYAAKYKKTVNAIANYVQREYKGRENNAKAVKELSLPYLQIPGFPKARTRETVVDPVDILQIPNQLHFFTKIGDFLHTRCKKSLLDVKNLPVD